VIEVAKYGRPVILLQPKEFLHPRETEQRAKSGSFSLAGDALISVRIQALSRLSEMDILLYFNG
jgi:hypothetical protein